jgi:hypothetical protein
MELDWAESGMYNRRRVGRADSSATWPHPDLSVMVMKGHTTVVLKWLIVECQNLEYWGPWALTLCFIVCMKCTGWALTLLYCVYEMYRVSIRSFTDYKHLLQENYVEYKHNNCNITINTWHKILETNLTYGKKRYVCIPRSFFVINVRNQGKTLCSFCIF